MPRLACADPLWILFRESTNLFLSAGGPVERCILLLGPGSHGIGLLRDLYLLVCDDSESPTITDSDSEADVLGFRETTHLHHWSGHINSLVSFDSRLEGRDSELTAADSS